MIKRNQRYFNWINRLTDMAIFLVSYYVAVWFWIFLMKNDTENVAVSLAFQHYWILFIVALGFVSVFQYCGLYDSFRSRSLLQELLCIIGTFGFCIATAVAFIFLFKARDFSRGVVICFAALSFILLYIKRLLLRLVLRYIRKQGYNLKHVILVGHGMLAEKYLDTINSSSYYGFNCIGYVSDSENKKLGIKLGNYAELENVIETKNPDEIIITLEQEDIGNINFIIAICEEQGIRTNILPLYNDYLPDCAVIDVMGAVKLINIRANSQDIAVNRVLKRIIDLVFSTLAIIILSPLMLGIAVAVKLSSPGPILFKQIRIGMDRKEFEMLKFRSMLVNASSDTAWSKKRDSRVTPVGAFIRKFSLDELPQFFNVIKGEMSIVGPRPELPFFVEKYRRSVPRYMVKHQVKPGITGWAQVNGYRGDTSITKRIEYDIWYIENWSFLLEFKIMLMTFFGGMMNKEKNMGRREKDK